MQNSNNSWFEPHADYVKTGCQGAEVVKEEKEIDKARDDRKKSAPGLPGKESFPEVEDAANSEKLAGNKHYQNCEEAQVNGTPELVRVDEY